jgi:hypothetical protein
LTHNLALPRAALERQRRRSTALIDGAYAGIEVGELTPLLLIVFSDGLDTASWLPADKVLDAAKRRMSSPTPLPCGLPETGVPSRPDRVHGRPVEVEKTEKLDAINGILQGFCQRYLVSYTPRGVARKATSWTFARRGGVVKAPGLQS